MLKSFLILMLMTTQLLAGSGRSVYLCIGDDGSFCCLDMGPASCTCCADQEVEISEEHSGCGCGCDESKSSRDSERSSRMEPSAESILRSGDLCGCTHILLSSEQPSLRVARMSGAVDADYFAQFAAETPAVSGTGAAIDARHSCRQRFRPPTISSHALTVLSCVSIRC